MIFRRKATVGILLTSIICYSCYLLFPRYQSSNNKKAEEKNFTASDRSRRKASQNLLDSRRDTTISRKNQDAIVSILNGESILEYIPGKSDAAAIDFYRELHRALRSDLQSSLDYSQIRRVFLDLNSNESHISVKNNSFLIFLANLKTSLGPSVDFSEKISIFKSKEPESQSPQFEKFLHLLGTKKEPGTLDPKLLSSLSFSEMKSLATGMAESGDLTVIDNILIYSNEVESEILDVSVRELMRRNPGKSIVHFDEISDPKVRTYCLKIAVESVRRAGAHADASEWEKVINMPRQ